MNGYLFTITFICQNVLLDSDWTNWLLRVQLYAFESQKHRLELAAQAVAVYVSYVYFSVTGNEAGSSSKVETLHNTFSWCSCLPP